MTRCSSAQDGANFKKAMTRAATLVPISHHRRGYSSAFARLRINVHLVPLQWATISSNLSPQSSIIERSRANGKPLVRADPFWWLFIQEPLCSGDYRRQLHLSGLFRLRLERTQSSNAVLSQQSRPNECVQANRKCHWLVVPVC